MNLDPEQMRLISLLVHDPGYMLLLDSIQADLDDLADLMEREPDEKRLMFITRKWQVLRSLLSTLKLRPQKIREEVEEMNLYPEELRPAPPKPEASLPKPSLKQSVRL